MSRLSGVVVGGGAGSPTRAASFVPWANKQFAAAAVTMAVAVACARCTSDVSKEAPYAALIGTEVHLKEEAGVWEFESRVRENSFADFEFGPGNSPNFVWSGMMFAGHVGPDCPLRVAKVVRQQLLIRPPERSYADAMILEFTPYWAETPIQAQMDIGPPRDGVNLAIQW